MATKIQVRRGTASGWTTANTVLDSGELGFETDTGLFKIGNGSTAWDELGYAGGEWKPGAAELVALNDVDVSGGLNDGDLLLYDGTAGEWKPGAVGGGGLVAVKHVLKTDTEALSTGQGGPSVAVPDLSITHEVADASNRLIISAFFGAAASSDGYGTVGIAVHDGTGFIAVGDADGFRTRVTAGGLVSTSGTNANLVVTMPSVTFVHTPGAGSKTYTVHAINVRISSATLYINRTENNDNQEDVPRAVSSLVIQEVSV